ncbi:MAG: hypothetical protein NZM43_10925 [Saprospiraceae bacterium]|nr:hypothetical protein [Saprospiraceae bacterium]MDW8484820.1 hypothetical protein [Saprospiraceae bacterium]
MYTINVYLRFALIAGGVLGGIVLWLVYGFWYGFPFLLVGLFLLVGYLLLGTLVSTSILLSQARFEEAEKRLKLTFFPNLLLMGYKGVYYMTKGILAVQKKDLPTGEKWLRTALEVGLPSDNERGAVLLQLAMIAGSKNNRQAAQAYLNDLKKLNITEPMLKEQIKGIEKQLKQMSQAFNPSMIGFLQRGGNKRRMPRIR